MYQKGGISTLFLTRRIKRSILISNNANNFEAGLCGVC